MSPEIQVFKKATIGRFDSLRQIGFRDGENVQVLLERAEITLGRGDEINDETGRTISPTETATETTYYVVTNFKNGKN